MRVRKQVYELTPDDLQKCPVWEFALDEEGEEGQDEATVRPRPELKAIADRSEGDLVCAAEFRLADDTVLNGYIYAQEETNLGAVQPVIVTRGGQVAFWHGVSKPDPDQIARAYAALGRAKEAVFPVSFRSAVEVEGKRMEGVVPAFLYREDDFRTVSEVHEPLRARCAMGGDHLKKAQSGDPLKIPAATFNTFVDVARDFQVRTRDRGRRQGNRGADSQAQRGHGYAWSEALF